MSRRCLEHARLDQKRGASSGEKLIALTFDLCETDGDVAGYDGRSSICSAAKG